MTQAWARAGWMLSVVLLSLLLAACGGEDETPADAADSQDAAQAAGNADAAPVNSAEIAPIEPLDPAQSQPPVRLQIPEIGLDAPVAEMGWQIAMVDGTRTTTWVVPETELGWHSNSAGAGAAGNTILSGNQVGESAPLLELAVGNIQSGQEVRLTDADGLVFVYRITEVSEPIAAVGATEADEQAAAAYFAPTDTPRLTLATGWPEFTTTHRIFAVAELLGVAP